MVIIDAIVRGAVCSGAYNAIAYSGLPICFAVQSMAYSGKQVALMGPGGSLSGIFPLPIVLAL